MVQGSPIVGDKERNLQYMESKIEDSDADLIAFGELFLTGYRCRDRYFELAESIEGDTVKRLSKLASEKNCYIIFGMPERGDEKGIIYNTAVLIHPDENVNRYRKCFLANFSPFEEKLYFKNGKELKAFKTEFGKIGILICFDLFFPEVCKIYSLQNADLLICISASPSATRVFFEKVMIARAIENTSFFLYCNLVGTEENLVFWGGNTVVSPRGDVLAKGDYFREQSVECELDLKDLDIARPLRPVLRDNREEIIHTLYELLGRDIKKRRLSRHNQ